MCFRTDFFHEEGVVLWANFLILFPTPPGPCHTIKKLWVGEDGLLIALPLCAPSFGWHHRTQMTSREARGFQQQHLALWQMVRPSGSRPGLSPDVSHTSSVCELPLSSAGHFPHKVILELAGSYLRRGSYVFPSGVIFYTKMSGSKGLYEWSTRAISLEIWGAEQRGGGCRNKSYCVFTFYSYLFFPNEIRI